jgi:hypothetical protein
MSLGDRRRRVRYSPIAGLSDEGMKLLMKDAVDKTYRFLRMLLDHWMERAVDIVPGRQQHRRFVAVGRKASATAMKNFGWKPGGIWI